MSGVTRALQTVYQVLFPATGLAVRLREWIGFGVLMIVYLAVLLILRFTERLVFLQPGYLWLFPLLGAWVYAWRCQGATNLTRFRTWLALVSRLVLLVLLLMALADPQAVRKTEKLSVMYALDLSDSVAPTVVDQALRYTLETVGGKQSEDSVGMVVFAREPAVELPPRLSFPFETVNSQLVKDGTNLEKALGLAAMMIPEEQNGRIILMSDGAGTEGRLDAAADSLVARKIPVDVLPVQTSIDKEVWLERLDLPRSVKIGESYEAHVMISALQAGRGTLVVRENGEEIYRDEVAFDVGKTRVTLPIYLRKAGHYDYVAKLFMQDGQDGWEGNNVALNDLYLRGEGKIMLVHSIAGDSRDWASLQQALQESGREVVIHDSLSFPRQMLALQEADAIVFVNVGADEFDTVQLESVRQAVYQLGVGFLMVGGPHSYGPGGYHRTAIEEAMPVSMDVKQKKVLPKGALVMVLHTCEFAEGNTWAKRIAIQAMKVLGAQDEVGVIAYEAGQVRWVFDLTPATEFDALSIKINQCQPGDMPAFGPALQLGLDGLKANDAAMKHMIVISDGDPSPPTPEMVRDFADNQISVSTIGINPHTANDVAILESIAAETKGRFYFPDDANELPSIFIKEAKTLKRNMMVNKRISPQAGFPSPVMKGIDAVPDLLGLTLTTIKPRAHTVLLAPGEEEDAPILALWRYGMGATAAFTSDLSPNWGAEWVGWAQYRAFVSQLVMEIARISDDSQLSLRVEAEGSTGVIDVEDQKAEASLLEMEARVIGPNQREESLTIAQTGPGRYRATFPLWGQGRYQVMVAAVGENRNERVVGGLSVAYSSEYLQLHSDVPALERLAKQTGGRVLNGTEADLFDFPRVMKSTSDSVIDWFFLALACLIPLDVGLRRIQIDFAWLKSRRQRAEAPQGTVGSLLQGKKNRREADRPESPSMVPIRTVTAPPPPSPTPTATPPPAVPPATINDGDSDVSLSTAERLLARKRRRQQESPED